MNRMLDEIFGVKKDYLCFYDKVGILHDGLWILFKDGVNTVFKILKDPVFGDMMLAIDRNKQSIQTYEEMEECNPDPQHIVGIAIISPQEPGCYQEFISNYFSNIKKKINKTNKYNKSIYLYLLDRLDDCRIRVVRNVTMQGSGRT